MDPRETSQSWADKENNFHMVDVSSKAATYRRAEAIGRIRMTKEAFNLVSAKKLPKGDALALAEMAGILAAKQTPLLLPLCHPLPIEKVDVRCHLDEKNSAVIVHCEVSTNAKTGVEMEALMGVNGALLCLYDLIKMVEPALVVENIRLNFKEGGKRGMWRHPEAKESSQTQATEPFLTDKSCAVLTISDRAAAGVVEDVSGKVAQEQLVQWGAGRLDYRVVADEKHRIQSAVMEWVETNTALIVLSGGTGAGPRDVTIGALMELAPKELKGMGELLRKEGASKKSSAWLSNSGGFVLKSSLVIALPGSPKAVREGLETLKSLLPHALHVLKGGQH